MHKKVSLSRFSNNWYRPGSVFKRILWYWVNLFFFQSYILPINTLKVFVLKLFGAKVGENCVIKPGVNIKYPWKLKLGNYVWIGEKVWIDNLDEVIIEDNCCVSQGALLLSGNHNYKSTRFDLIIKPIVLKEGVWIGAKSIVFQGVVCESHSVLALGSSLSSNMEPYSIYRGNPAVKIKDRVIG